MRRSAAAFDLVHTHLQRPDHGGVQICKSKRSDILYTGKVACRLDKIRKVDDFLECCHSGTARGVPFDRGKNVVRHAEMLTGEPCTGEGMQRFWRGEIGSIQHNTIFFRQTQLLVIRQPFGNVVQNTRLGGILRVFARAAVSSQPRTCGMRVGLR